MKICLYKFFYESCLMVQLLLLVLLSLLFCFLKQQPGKTRGSISNVCNKSNSVFWKRENILGRTHIVELKVYWKGPSNRSF